MKTVYAVMYNTGYDGPDDIIELFESEKDAKEHIKGLLLQDKFSRSSDYYISELDLH